jgi:spore germination protein YaaH
MCVMKPELLEAGFRALYEFFWSKQKNTKTLSVSRSKIKPETTQTWRTVRTKLWQLVAWDKSQDCHGCDIIISRKELHIGYPNTSVYSIRGLRGMKHRVIWSMGTSSTSNATSSGQNSLLKVDTHQTTRRHIPDAYNLYNLRVSTSNLTSCLKTHKSYNKDNIIGA